jgi:hypothetical protein
MSCRTVPEKVNDFLVRCTGRKYCDTCIQERLGLKWRQQVQLITATLAVTRSFAREFGPCCVCHQAKQVIYATAPAPSAAPMSDYHVTTMVRPELSASERAVRDGPPVAVAFRWRA